MSHGNNYADVAPLTFSSHLILTSISQASFYSLSIYISYCALCFFCCRSFLPGPSYTWDLLQFSYGCSTSLIIAGGAVHRQNRDISRVAECGEDNGVKREKSRLPQWLSSLQWGSNRLIFVQEIRMVFVQTNKRQHASPASPCEQFCFPLFNFSTPFFE